MLVSESDHASVGDDLLPIVVDLDGTLTPTDTLYESVVQMAKAAPPTLLLLPLWLARGRAALKEEVARRGRVAADCLPYDVELLAYLRAEKARGRRIILATAAHASVASAVADHLGLFDLVLASRDGHNLKGEAKLAAIRQAVEGPFVYAGDSAADLPVWRAAARAIVVGARAGLAAQVQSSAIVERQFPRTHGAGTWVKALRLHQWVKNILVFVPLLTSFSFLDLPSVVAALAGFLAFSLTASATYVVNDLLDLESDRRHPRKRKRPFASAQIPIPLALAVAALLLVAGLATAWAVSPGFLTVLLLYLALTSAYSWGLKTYVLVDVLLLSTLYTIRILAGSVAVGVVTSDWLLAFSALTFLSLALIKRCAELVSFDAIGQAAARGRDYRVADLQVLSPLGAAASLSAVVLFCLFISTPETRSTYTIPDLLWLAAVGLTYWMARLWIKTARGEMHDDPVVYALRDGGSRLTLAGVVIVFLLARYLGGVGA